MDSPYKIDNVEVLKIYKSTNNKDGKPFVSSKGNAFTKVDIYISPSAVNDSKFEGKMTYFDYYDNSANWEQGTTISGEVVRNDVNDRTYFNFNLPPTGKKALESDIKKMQEDIEMLKEAVFGKKVEGKTEEVQEAIDFSKEALKDDSSEEEDQLPF